MRRIEHAVLALALLAGFVADLRYVVTFALGFLLWWFVRHRDERIELGAGIALLATSALSFAAGNEVAAWALALAVAVAAGVIAARPAARRRAVQTE